MKIRPTRLFWRIYLLCLAGIMIALMATTWHSAHTLQRFYEQQISNDLTIRALFAARELTHSDELQEDKAQRLCEELAALTGDRITIVLPSGKVAGDSEEDPLSMQYHLDRPEIAAALRGEIGRFTRFSNTLNKKLQYVAVPVFRDGQITAAARFSRPVADMRWNLREISNKILIVAVVAALFLAIATLYLSRRISLPMENMRQIAERFANGDLKARVDESGSDEIAALGRTLNMMAEQLKERLEIIVRQRSDLEAILTNMVEGVLAVDSDERIIQINRAAAGLIGIRMEHAAGRSIQEAARYYELQQFISDTLASKKPLESEIILYGEEERYLQVHGTPLVNEQSRNIGGLIVMNDVSRLKRLENARREFIANISHEIGTPMTAIKGCAETITSDPPPNAETLAKFIRMMTRQTERLEALVEDILTLSRIEYDQEHHITQLDEGSINEVIGNAVENFSELAANKNIGIQTDCHADLTALINAGLLEQAIGNLIDNAIKYSHEGTRILIAAASNKGNIEIKVADQGPGMAKKHLARIFERFYRIDPSRSRKLGGTGLGLAIVRHIVLAHGGRITVESEPGKGSVFTLTIPSNHFQSQSAKSVRPPDES